MDESHKKAQATRERNQAARKAQAEAREAERKQDTALMLEALRAVLRDPEATPEQRIFAVCVLDKAQYYNLVPYGVKYPGADSGKAIAAFAEELKAHQDNE